ncbi:PilZ domain-containing protein [Sphingomonas hylomeconis]|uniref:PilZ domain-containing protein n=1 Tax=Sphingomonas hylomeconis TaxID=1395958 RepID=A0ABV7SSE3_9SPHN|nr:PilZ domain-containing protein [Sphingomonas hylomeconis]
MLNLETSAPWSRSSPRRKVFVPSQMLYRGEILRVHLLNISRGGALISIPSPLPVGHTVAVGQGMTAKVATVVRVSNNRAAVEFRIPFSDIQMEEFIAMHEHAPDDHTRRASRNTVRSFA